MNNKPLLSIIVVAYNMRRELQRTLYSLTPTYQKEVEFKYEVQVIDHGSTEPVEKEYVEKFGENFKYKYVNTDLKSPCIAINNAVKKCESEYIMCCIDGARILSPKVLKRAMQAVLVDAHPFVYTTAYHLGNKVQKESILEGYTTEIEDKLLDDSQWQEDGYKLFDISTIAPSSRNGCMSPIIETNCFIMKRDDYISLGGYNEKFLTNGGGFSNIEFFERFVTSDIITPIALVGEATFHQIHGGAITNETRNRNEKMQKFKDEYFKITGKNFSSLDYDFLLFGQLKNR